MRSPRASILRAVAVAGAFGATAAAAPVAQAAPNPTVNPGDLVISEFRFHGPNGANDEFFEIYNKTNTSIDLNSDEDNSVFWIEYFAPTPEPADTVSIVPHSDSDVLPHTKYLMTNKPGDASPGYSLDGYAFGDTETDVQSVGDVPSDGGIALMYDSNVFDAVDERIVVDKAGFPNGKIPDDHYHHPGFTYFEGTAEPPISALTTQQYAHVRKFTGAGGQPLDTNNNASDFDFVVNASLSTYAGQPSIQGAPGPENTGSPILENDGATATPNDGMYSALMNTGVSSSTSPNRETAAGTPGTLIVRRRITNRTGHSVTSLRLRLTQLTTYGTASATQALLRATDIATATVAGEPALGAKVEQPPTQTAGGGLNSTLVVPLNEDTGLTGGVLPNGGDVVVAIKFLVDRSGSYSFSYNHEAE